MCARVQKAGSSTKSLMRVSLVVAVVAAVVVAAYASVPVLLHSGAAAVAQVNGSPGIPLQINHQGVVYVDKKRFDGVGEFRFALVDPDSGTNRWTNDGTHLGEPNMPEAAVPLEVAKGVYSVLLGDPNLANMVEIPTDVFDDDNMVLRIWFDDLQGNGVHQLQPDHVLASAPYAYRAFGAAEAEHALEADHALTADALTTPPGRVPPGAIVMWSGSIAEIPDGWALCDGNNGTPDLTSRFIKSVPNASTDPGSTGGSTVHTHAPGSYTSADHAHTFSGGTGGPSGPHYCCICACGTDSVASYGHGHQFSGTTSSSGGGVVTGTSAEASSSPPYYELAFIMKL